MFEDNLVFLLEKEIKLKDVLNSNIICHDLEFEENEWPYIHTNDSKIVKPYNNCIFKIRGEYLNIFHELREEDAELVKKKNDFFNKVIKIKYSVNSLPMMNNKDIYESNLMESMGSTTQTEIFQTKAVKEFINYKWNHYGKKVHYISATFHFLYVVSFLLYLNLKYLIRDSEDAHHYKTLITMLICNMYGMTYDLT